MRRPILTTLAAALLCATSLAAADADAPDFNRHVAPILQKYCNGCHNADDAEGNLVLENFDRVMRGGENGAVIVPKKSAESRLVLVLEKKVKPFMPPEGSDGPTAAEIAVLKAWIDAGAKGPEGREPLPVLVTPKIAPTGEVRKPVHSVAWSPDGNRSAVARYGVVEILDAQNQTQLATLSGHAGQVNKVGFSRDGGLLFAASGDAGLLGEVRLWNTSDWQLVRTIQGHRDSIYAAALSPDGSILATGSYDQRIKLWDMATGNHLRTLVGHNGAVFDLAFHPSGKILASASGDRTVKLWDVAGGNRLDTLVEPEKDQYAVTLSPDGQFVVAGGVDHRIRVWRIQKMGAEGTNTIVFSRVAHEAPIIDLVFSPDGKALISSSEDRRIKLWETRTMTQRHVLEEQSDWPGAVAVSPDSSKLLVGRLDGTVATYPIQTQDLESARAAVPLTGLPTPQPAVAATAQPPAEMPEVEPNDDVSQSTKLSAPAVAAAVLLPAAGKRQDVDLYQFESKLGQAWVIETSAVGKKSPADTKIEVLDADGKPVERLLLQAVRDSYLEFRPIDSLQSQARLKNWEEMELNQFLFMAGEVVKFFEMPRGPDSGMEFYKVNGKRKCYFDTSATIHALEDPVYIVEPYSPDTELIDNGLPVFPLYYTNDDDGERKLGSDSRLIFTAPRDGTYLVRVTDVRGFGGEDFKYWLTIREARPDFQVTIGGTNPTLAAGSGQRFTLTLDRIDGFNDEVEVRISDLPPGFTVSSPIAIEAGHYEARGVINAASGAQLPTKEQWSQIKVTASATIHGAPVSKSAGNLGELKLATEPPKVVVHLTPDRPVASLATAAPSNGPTEPELVVGPGTTITARLRIDRSDFDGELRFDVDNLPHGVIVDNIGLNGIMIREKESERQFFLTAAPWVTNSSRLIHAVAQGQGNQASLPIRLRVQTASKLAEVDGSVQPGAVGPK